MSTFHVLAYALRDATFAGSSMAALPLMDRCTLLHDSLRTALRIGRNGDAPNQVHMEPLRHTFHLVVSLSDISYESRRFFITYYSVVRGRMFVVAGVINLDIGVWENDLSTFMRGEYSGTIPPGAGTVIEMFPLLTWKGRTGFVDRGGSAAGHATLVARPRFRPIFNTQRRC